METTQHHFLSHYAKPIIPSPAKKPTPFAFKDHEQFPFLTDSLSRKDQHHLAIRAEFFPQFTSAYLEAFSQYLANELTPPCLHHAELFFLHFEQADTNPYQPPLEQSVRQFMHHLDTATHYFIFFLPATSANQTHLQPYLTQLTHHAKCRLIVLANTTDTFVDNRFISLTLNPLNESDSMAILRHQRTELEQFHHVIIPDELLSQALAFANRYLSAQQSLEKALLLLDSSAARAGISDQTEDSSQLKPILTTKTLLNVLAHWTHIPADYLNWQSWKNHTFQQNMQQRLFGQDSAISLIGQELQQFQAAASQHDGPLCRFLFAGPKHSGKKSTAVALTDHLFHHHAMLYCVQFPLVMTTHLLDMKLRSYQNRQPVSLAPLIQETPYAVIMLEHIEQAPPAIIQGLCDIFTTGYLHDDQGHYYDFRQSIFILTTTLGTQRLTERSKTLYAEEEAQHFDLMQLIMNEQKQADLTTNQRYSPHELAQDILPDLTAHLPVTLCQHLPIIPFLPLHKSAIEKMLRLKLKLLGKQLITQHGIELTYAPEVVRYLVKQVITKQEENQQAVNIDKVIKPLYAIVEQTVVSQADNVNRPNQLFLQLNETGQILRCDWLLMTAVRQHTPA